MKDHKDDNNKDDEVEILEAEKNLVLDHDYDGIKELDHPLPMWWVFIFVGTVVFSIPYYFYHVHSDSGPDSRSVLNEEMEKIHKMQADYEAKAGGFDVETFNAFVKTEEAAKIGKKTYQGQCSACHGPDGQGTIGPNLSDNYWMHGDGKLLSVYQVIAKGVTDKGMPAWKQTLDEKQMMAVTDFILKMKKVEGKEPQGELIEE
ncbi:MAG: c-type cytochrome [Bacteriovoracaceae bacterium]